ncbi:3961_t:CDS:1, partial [Racocetra fulgida]
DRTRITVMLAANATETEKLKPIVIGSSIEPHALVRLNYDALPVTYRSNLKAWMRTDIFCEWITTLDNKFRLENRHILLLVDGATSHYNPNDNNSQDMLELDEELNGEEES